MVIYVKEQGAYIQRRGEKIVVTKNGKTIFEIPSIHIDNISIIGNVQISTQALHLFLERGVDVSYFSYSGKYLGHLNAESSKNIFLRLEQYRNYTDQNARLAMAKKIVANKVDNQISLIERHRWRDKEYCWKSRLKAGKYGQIIKIPYGNHIRTNEMSYFLDEGEAILSMNDFLDNISTSSLSDIKRILALNSGIKMNEQINTQRKHEIQIEYLGNINDNILQILEKCSLMKYLCNKAITTKYLSHFERMSILFVFGHLGEEGCEFIHTIMSQTLNYQYHVTQKFINKIPEKPISCIKLREQYKQVTAEYGCNCVFKRSKKCYPSPVLHAISNSIDAETDITLPTSRTVPKEKQKKVLEEINIHKKAQDLASKIVECKKQKRKIDNNIIKIENELENIFNSASVDCLEIDMGMLVRRKKEKGYEWFIEL